MMTSPWLPTVFVGLVHSVQLTISFGFAGAETSTSRKPEYVPWTAVLPQNARSELKTPVPGPLLSSGTSFGENPSGCRSCYSNVAVASAGDARRERELAPTATAMCPTTSATQRSVARKLPFTTD